jgi:hypothetical protein
VFVRSTDLRDHPLAARPGTRVEFEVLQSPRGLKASDVIVLGVRPPPPTITRLPPLSGSLSTDAALVEVVSSAQYLAEIIEILVDVLHRWPRAKSRALASVSTAKFGNQFGGLKVDDATRLGELARENPTLNRTRRTAARCGTPRKPSWLTAFDVRCGGHRNRPTSLRLRTLSS